MNQLEEQPFLIRQKLYFFKNKSKLIIFIKKTSKGGIKC